MIAEVSPRFPGVLFRASATSKGEIRARLNGKITARLASQRTPHPPGARPAARLFFVDAVPVAGYCLSVAANSATGFSGPNYPRRTSATVTDSWRFFVPAVCVMAAVRGRLQSLPVPLDTGPLTRAQLPPYDCLAAIRGSSSIQGASP